MTANNDARAWIDPLKQFAGVLKDGFKLPLGRSFHWSGLGRGIFHTVGMKTGRLRQKFHGNELWLWPNSFIIQRSSFVTRKRGVNLEKLPNLGIKG